MTTANKITIFRILLIPFFVVQMLYYVRTGGNLHWVLALSAFALAALLDGVDGYIARRFNQKSELGAILDPLADKLLLVSAILLLSRDSKEHFAQIPLWLTATIIGRDILLVLGLGIIYYTFGKVIVRPSMVGKIATVLQMAIVLWILLRWPDRVLPYLIMGTAAFTALSGVLYLFVWIRQMNTSPASAASRNQ